MAIFFLEEMILLSNGGHRWISIERMRSDLWHCEQWRASLRHSTSLACRKKKMPGRREKTWASPSDTPGPSRISVMLALLVYPWFPEAQRLIVSGDTLIQ